MNNPLIACDFDGVIHSYSSGWQGATVIPDPPVDGAIQYLLDHLPCPDELCAMAPEYKGLVACIHSSRAKTWLGRRAIKKWLIKHGIHPSYFKENILKIYKYKPPAIMSLDDRAICFNGQFPVDSEIKAFRPWNKT